MMVTRKPTGMVVLMLAGWLGCLPRAARRTLEVLPEGRLMGRMNKLTLLDDAVGGFGGATEGGWAGEAGRLRRAGRWLPWESYSGEVVPVNLESASFLRQSPVVNDLSLTCSSTC